MNAGCLPAGLFACLAESFVGGSAAPLVRCFARSLVGWLSDWQRRRRVGRQAGSKAGSCVRRTTASFVYPFVAAASVTANAGG